VLVRLSMAIVISQIFSETKMVIIVKFVKHVCTIIMIPVTIITQKQVFRRAKRTSYLKIGLAIYS